MSDSGSLSTGPRPWQADRLAVGTLRPVKSSVEALEGNKVKVSVEVEEAEFDKDLDSAFKVLAKEVRLPGFRPGKAPRKVLEARIGSGYAREQAFRDGLPTYYAEACKEHDVDVIAPPEIEIIDGHESGPVTFDAVVEVRPSITVSGYEALQVEIPSPLVDDSEIDESVERFLTKFAELVDVERPGAEGDTALVDITGEYEGEAVPGLTAEGYRHVIGSQSIVPEIDAHISGASAGDTLTFTAAHPDEDEEGDLEFTIVVTSIQESVPPEATDEFMATNSEFANLDEMRADFTSKAAEQRRNQAITARRNSVAEQVAALVAEDDLPESLVELEVENRAQEFAMRLQSQGLDLAQYLQFTGQSRDDVMVDMRGMADTSARLDLALRAIAASEGLEITEDDLETEFERIAPQVGASIEDVRQQFTDAGQLSAIRSDLQKSKALDWLVDHATVVDEDGNAVNASDLEEPESDAKEEEDAE